MNDGTTAAKEVVVFGRFAPDGRFAELGETGVDIVEDSAAEGPRLPDAGALDVRVILCGAVRQLIVLRETDLAIWDRYATMVLNAFTRVVG